MGKYDCLGAAHEEALSCTSEDGNAKARVIIVWQVGLTPVS